MMKLKMLWTLLLLNFVCALSAHATPANKTQIKAMNAVYAIQDRALATKNVNALLAQTTIDFQRKSVEKTRVGREKEREYIVAVFQNVKSFVSVRTTLKTLRFDRAKNVLVAVATTRFFGVFRDAAGKWSKQSFSTNSRDTWVSTKNGWRLRLTEEVK